MKLEKLNEDCGCGAGKSPEPRPVAISRRSNDPNIGKMATLRDGRQALVEDSIRSSGGDVIGYILTNEQGAFRVFKEKVQNFSESEGAMSTLPATQGQGEVTFPSPVSVGSGDKFPCFFTRSRAQSTSPRNELRLFDLHFQNFLAENCFFQTYS